MGFAGFVRMCLGGQAFAGVTCQDTSVRICVSWDEAQSLLAFRS